MSAASKQRSPIGGLGTDATAPLHVYKRFIAEMPLAAVVGERANDDAPLVVAILNKGAEAAFGCDETAVGLPLNDILPAVAIQDVLCACERALAGDHPATCTLLGCGRGNNDTGGVLRTHIVRLGPGIVGLFATDVTEIHALEHQIRAAQRMQTVGRLAGGIAHDFNNILAVIESHAEFVAKSACLDDQTRRDVEVISDAAKRASRLTDQILAYSRRQPQQLEVLCLNDAVTALDRILQQTLGETIRFDVELQPKLRPVSADLTQLEQVIMNLAVNARDAMPKGGRLIVTTADCELEENAAGAGAPVPAGSYVRLVVRDTGSGMAPDALEQIFEPFFTTKPRGRGTGLGLSTVYGIIKQSGGHIAVQSELGQGTAFEVYLPAVLGNPIPKRQPKERTKRALGGTETVLVAEDEELVRDAAARILTGAGYRVLEARDGEHAVEVAAEHQGSIHLLLTDVVMPGLGGQDAAAALDLLKPGVRVLFMSGYTDNAIGDNGTLREGTNFLRKPFRSENLLEKVRGALDAGTDVPSQTDALPPGRVVIVDDDEHLRDALRRLIEEEDYTVEACADIAAAKALLRDPSRCAAILCDLHLGDESGLDLFHWVSENTPDLVPHFFLLTGGATDQRGTEFIKAHNDRVITKPVKTAQLHEKLAILSRMVVA